MAAELQPSLLKETGALVVAGAPFCVFELGGKPRGKGAPRTRVVIPTGWKFRTELPTNWTDEIFATIYTDAKTEAYMQALAWAARAAMRSKPPTSRPVAVILHAFMPIPQSWTMREKADARLGALLPTGKPDWDNIGKMLDALKGIVWMDDAPVIDGRVIKRYDDDPALRVEVREFVPPT